MLSALPIRSRLAAGFWIAMAAVLVGLGVFVYFRVDRCAARLGRPDASERRRVESSQHVRGGSLIDTDARESGTVVEVLDAQRTRDPLVRRRPAGVSR